MLATNGEALSVFELKDVPLRVISDALNNWPANNPLPNNLAEFEFATRKQGKGNHPWILKFNGCKPVTISYGGRAKTGSTVGTHQGG